MKSTISEFAMLAIAFNGKVNEKEGVINFDSGALPEWVYDMFDSSIVIDANGAAIIKLYNLIPGKWMLLSGVLSQPKLLTRLYNTRWITPVNFAKELSDEDFSDFIHKFEKSISESNLVDSSMLFNTSDDVAFFMVLNFITIWSNDECYETDDGKTVFRCNKSILPENIDIKSLCITDKLHYMGDAVCTDLPIMDVVYFVAEFTEVKEMLVRWYRVLIQSLNPYEEIKKLNFEGHIEIDDALMSMMMNALNQHELMVRTDLFSNDEDEVIANLIYLSRLYGLPLFTEPANKGNYFVFMPIYDFKRSHVNYYATFMYELSKLTRKSNNWYIDVSGNLIMFNHSGLIDLHCRDRIDFLKKYLDDSSQLFPALNYVIKSIEKKQLIDTIESRNISKYQHAMMINTDNTGHVLSEDILIDFALYYIRKSNIMTDSAIESYLMQIMPKGRKLCERKLVDSYTVKLFLMHFSKISSDESGFEKAIVDSDKEIDDFVWDLGIHGMIDCVISIATAYPDKHPEIATQVRCLLSLLKPLDENILSQQTSNLMKVAIGDISFMQKDGENLLMLCAALNKETYKSLAYTNYIIENLLYIGNLMYQGPETSLLKSIVTMESILNISDAGKFKRKIQQLLTTNRIPTPIRKLGSDVLKSVLTTHSKFALSNRKDFLDVLNNIDATADQPSNAHIFNEFASDILQTTDMLCLKKLLLYGYKLGFVKTSIIDSDITSFADIVPADKVQIIMSKLDRA